MTNLYIQTAFLGDLLLSLPVIKQVRYWDSKSSLKVVCRKGYGELLHRLNVCDEVYELDKSQPKLAYKALSQTEYKTIFSPHQSFRTHQLVGKLKASRKVGYSRIWNQFHFDTRVHRQLSWPEVMRQMQLLAAVDDNLAIKLESFSKQPEMIPSWAQMHLTGLSWNDEDMHRLVSKLTSWPSSGPIICLAPGSVWPTKRWGLKSFTELARKLSAKGYNILLMGAPDERKLCESIQSQIGECYLLAGQLSIFESLMVMSQSQALVCNDSGAMHLASLLHLPTVALFGPTVVELGYKPWNPRAVVLSNPDLLCRPCGQHGGKVCPIGTHFCMESLGVDQVISELGSLLA